MNCTVLLVEKILDQSILFLGDYSPEFAVSQSRPFLESSSQNTSFLEDSSREHTAETGPGVKSLSSSNKRGGSSESFLSLTRH
jgi:hypothetical protein